ncbi:hypothetical protein B0H13DRAFT_2421069 [Mycena leptocephala]|nr:hypothetical protein B0H13DRAFT_2421069 [Mycena leptocephala]
MEAELKTCTYDTARLRIIGLGEKNFQLSPTAIEESFAQLIAGWMETIPQLAQGSDRWPKPQTLHLDFAAGGIVIEPTRRVVGPDCKILICHLNDYDFVAIAQEIYADEARREGRSMDDIMDAVRVSASTLSGRIIKCPGVYDYERVCHSAGPTPGFGQLLAGAQKLTKIADGIIPPSSVCIEPVGVPYYRGFYKKRGQELFTIGLQAHELYWTDAPPASPTNATVAAFLDSALTQYGPKSVLYISFGSLFFPIAMPALVEALVDALLSVEQPLSPDKTKRVNCQKRDGHSRVPSALIARVNASARGLACDFWVEQRAIMHHRALDWFLTHGGFNSVSESLSQGIPLIVWPSNAEQPVNAALLHRVLTVAIELLQVRKGPQPRPSLRGGPTITGTVEDASAEFTAVFRAARGSRGAILRANAVKMAAALRAARAGAVGDELKRLALF